MLNSQRFKYKHEMTDNADYTSRFADNSYIQNNTRNINRRISILTPSFRSETFMEFAKKMFSELTERSGIGDFEMIASRDIDLSQLPEKIDSYNDNKCYMHNLIIENNNERLKVLLTVKNNGSLPQGYFVVFTRKSSMKNVTKGGVIAVSCLYCGGVLKFEQKALKMCPYCGKPVKYAEYDWIMTSVERINDNTLIDNRAVVEVQT